MTGFSDPIIGGDGALVYPSIHSPDYLPGVSGWTINKDGSAEFSDVTVRGEFDSVSSTGPVYFDVRIADGIITVLSASSPGGPFTTLYTLTAAANAAGTWAMATFSRGLSMDGTEAWLPPSGDVTGFTDRVIINGLLGLNWTVHLLPGTWYVDSPVQMPDGACLTAADPSWGIPTGNYGAGGLPLQGSVIQAGTAFAGAALITMGVAGTSQLGGQRLYGITVSGTGAPAGTHGIQSTGYNAGVKMRDVVVWGMPGDGLHAGNDGTPSHTPDFWQVQACKFSGNTGWGVLTQGLSDSWFDSCESTGNNAGGWSITGGSDTRFTCCRADSNIGSPGWSLNPTITGRVYFTNCEANLNGTTGWVFAGGVAMDYFLTGCIAAGNTGAAYSYAAGARVHCDGGNFTVWVALALSNGWANSGAGPAAQFTWRGSSVEVIADLLAGTLAAGTGILTFPAAVTFSHAQQLVLTDITTRTAQGALNAGAAGVVSFFQGLGTVAAGDRCFLHGFLSADA